MADPEPAETWPRRLLGMSSRPTADRAPLLVAPDDRSLVYDEPLGNSFNFDSPRRLWQTRERQSGWRRRNQSTADSSDFIVCAI